MQDYILKGVVLRAIDWKEKDKLVTIITPEKGLLTINLRGVRQQKSKMKFATQPMCFAEFNVMGSGDVLTCVGVNEIESFFAITQDYDDMVLASAIMEMCLDVSTKEANVELFVLLVRTLSQLCNNEVEHNVVFLKFCLELFKIMGYAINFDYCKSCEKKLDSANLDFSLGAIVCDDCINVNCEHLSLSSFKILSFVNSFPFDELNKVRMNDEQILECKQILVKNFNTLFEKRLKSIKV